MIKFEIKIPKLPMGLRPDASAVLRAELAKAGLQSVLLLEKEIAKLVPVNLGTLRDSIQAEQPRWRTGELVGLVGTPLPYALPIEYGRRVGERWPPDKAIEQWVRRKLGLVGVELRRVAYAIRRSIGKKGTKPIRMFEKGTRASQSRIMGFIQKAIDRFWTHK